MVDIANSTNVLFTKKIIRILGITHAGVWAAMSSLIAHNTEPELRSSTQGFLQGIHHGFGKFCGAVFGGMLIKEHGKILPSNKLPNILLIHLSIL